MVLQGGTITATITGETLANVNNLISGFGTIGTGNGDLTLNNELHGTIDANDPTGRPLILDTENTVTNAGTLKAAAGGILQIDDVVDNSGVMIATAGGGTVGGEIDVKATSIDNTGTGSNGISVGNLSTLLVDVSNLQLNGSGAVTLSAGSQILGNGSSGSPDTLENVNNTISGAGTIGAGDGHLALTNDIGGTVKTGVLTLDTGDQITNAGILEATSGGTLQLDDNVANSGTIEATGAASSVKLNDVTIAGGTLSTGSVTSRGGVIEVVAAAGANTSVLSGGETVTNSSFAVPALTPWNDAGIAGSARASK